MHFNILTSELVSESLMPVFENAQQLPYHRAVIKLSLTAILMWLLSYVSTVLHWAVLTCLPAASTAYSTAF
jgi:hypothetical protein